MCVANYKLLSIYLPNGFFKATICVIHSVYTFVHNYNKTGEIFRPPYFMGKKGIDKKSLFCTITIILSIECIYTYFIDSCYKYYSQLHVQWNPLKRTPLK